MSDNLFDKLQQTTRVIRKVALRPGETIEELNPATGKIMERDVPIMSMEPVTFEIHSITTEEAQTADEFITAIPEPIIQRQESPSGKGDVDALVGYDDQHPKYLADLRKQVPMKNAAMCLFGCPALMSSTPGGNLEEKARKLVSSLPGGMIDWLADRIDRLKIFTAVGEEAVSRFLSQGSGEQSASSSNTRSRTNGSGKSGKKPTARTSTTKKRK